MVKLSKCLKSLTVWHLSKLGEMVCNHFLHGWWMPEKRFNLVNILWTGMIEKCLPNDQTGSPTWFAGEFFGFLMLFCNPSIISDEAVAWNGYGEGNHWRNLSVLADETWVYILRNNAHILVYRGTGAGKTSMKYELVKRDSHASSWWMGIITNWWRSTWTMTVPIDYQWIRSEYSERRIYVCHTPTKGFDAAHLFCEGSSEW